MLHSVQVKFFRCTVQKFNILRQLGVVGSADQLVQAGVAQLGLDLDRKSVV